MKSTSRCIPVIITIAVLLIIVSVHGIVYVYNIINSDKFIIDCGKVYANEQTIFTVTFQRGMLYDKITTGCGCSYILEYRLDAAWHPMNNFDERHSRHIDAIKIRIYVTAKPGIASNQFVYFHYHGKLVRTLCLHYEIRSRSFLCSDYTIYFGRQAIATEVNAVIYLYNSISDQFRCVKWNSNDPDIQIDFVEQTKSAPAIEGYTPLGMISVRCAVSVPKVIDSIIVLHDDRGQESTIQIKGEFEPLVRVAPAQSILPLYSHSGKVYQSRHIIRSYLEKEIRCRVDHIPTGCKVSLLPGTGSTSANLIIEVSPEIWEGLDDKQERVVRLVAQIDNEEHVVKIPVYLRR